MWKSYKVFMKKWNRIGFYAFFPLFCIMIYAAVLIAWAPVLKSGELIHFFEVNSERTEANVFVILLSILPCIPFFLTDECSFGDLFHGRNESTDFLRRSCNGKDVFLKAVIMDFLIRIAVFAFIFGGAVLVETLIGAWHGFELRSWSMRGTFFLLEVVTCSFAVTLAVTLGRMVTNMIVRFLFVYLGMGVAGFMTLQAWTNPWLILVMSILSLLLTGISVGMAKWKWEENARDDQRD